MSYFKNVILALVASVCLAIEGAPAWAQTPAEPRQEPKPAEVERDSSTSLSAAKIMGAARKSVFQIKGSAEKNASPSVFGTGFAVRPDGIAITNYHVISGAVVRDTPLHLTYELDDGSTGKLEVIAVDIVNDLALVRAVDAKMMPLSLGTTPMDIGSKAYSVGFPLDVGLSMTEGVSNGPIEDQFVPRLHYSGALNAGMSGGPVFDGAGQVSGVNVSGYQNAQLVNFLIPVAAVHDLLKSAPASDVVSVDTLQQDIEKQATAFSKRLLSELRPSLKSEAFMGYSYPAKISPFVKCTAAEVDPSKKQKIQGLSTVCQFGGAISLEPGRAIGAVRFSHMILHSSKIASWRFMKRFSSATSIESYPSTRQFVGPYACQQDEVSLDGFDALTLLCVRSNRKKPEFSDFIVRVASLNGETAGLVSRVWLSGVNFADGLGFIEQFLGELRFSK